MHTAVYPERSRRGYTLVELLVVISILAIMGGVGFISLNSFSSNQVTSKAVGQIQSMLRLAQSNATTSTICSNNEGSKSWSARFTNNKTIELYCSSAAGDKPPKTYTLENASMKIECAGNVLSFPITVTYSTGSGALTTNPVCSSLFVFTLSNTLNANATVKTFKVSKGGAIDVQ